MLEVAAAGVHHRPADGEHGVGHLGVALRATGLDERPHASVERELDAVGRDEGAPEPRRAASLGRRLVVCPRDVVDALERRKTS